MSWKFWTWPRLADEVRIEKANQEYEYKKADDWRLLAERLTRELTALKEKQIEEANEPNAILPVPPHDLQLLQNRVACLAADDPLWPMLVALLRRNMQTDLEALAPAGIGDEEAHRGRGRIGMILDLEAQFNQLWADTHRQVEKEEEPETEG